MVFHSATSSPVHPDALLPATGYLRLSQIIGRKPNPEKGDSGLPAIVPVSASTLWQWTRDKKFPAPAKLGPRVTAWKVEEVRQWLERDVA